jgi:Leucine-rich repeat (LRR) protein
VSEMARDEAYRRAEERIEEALRFGAEQLDLSDMELTELPESVARLTRLRSLNVSKNQLTTLPKALGQLTQLRSLNVSKNQLTTLPKALGQLTQLQTLRLYLNQLTALPEWLGQLTQLQMLSLWGNQLTHLPESLGRLTRLQTLDLSRSELTALPEWVCQLTQLQTLDLTDNQLTALPESLDRLTQLQTLDLSVNPLTALPEWLGQLTELRELGLLSTQLTSLPESLGQLAQLQRLSLWGNQLTDVPKSLSRLTRLRTLDLSNNHLTALPESLGQLTQLQTLSLSRNQLTALPESLGRLTQLQTLDLSHNQLTALPGSLRELTELKALDLNDNDRLGIPPEILGPPDAPAAAASILDYYFSTRGREGQALRELKLLVVGRGGAGKTSLVRRLNGERLDPAESETHGININPLELICHDGPVTARVWDFGGQHVLHAMHEFFLTARSLYLLVLGERDDMAERDATYWLQLIRSYAGSAPVVIALNKSKGRSREMDRESLQQHYGPILAWVSTECADGFDQTIGNLRAALTEAADGMSEIRDLFPSKWWKVKEWLEEMDDPYIDFATYQKRCKGLGEQDPKRQETLAARLNDLGIAINYAEDERLHDTTVLRPDWLANGIYAILRANDSNHDRRYAPDAMLTVKSLGPIYAAAEKLNMLKATDYPPDMWPFLLRLMGLFQLAFPIDDRGKTLLVPTLLPAEPPPGCDEPPGPDRTRLRYEFAVVPGPLLPKLLVRTFSLIEEERRWRRGAILRFGQARARVWTTQDERWVHITAVGDNKDRNDLLTMIRVTLRELFAEYRDLHAVEQWEHNGKWVPRGTLEDFGVLTREEEEGEEVER